VRKIKTEYLQTLIKQGKEVNYIEVKKLKIKII